MADDAWLGSVTAPVKSFTLIFEGACEMTLNNSLIHVESLALLAIAPRRQAEDNSRPLDTASLG